MGKASILLIGITFFSFKGSFGQEEGSYKKETLLLKEALEANHYNPPALDDQLSKHIFSHFIHLLDPNAIYFSIQDIQELSKFQGKLDDELGGHSWEFLPLVTSLYKDRLLSTERLIADLLRNPLAFNNEEAIIFFKDKNSRPYRYKEDYRNHVEKWLKFQTLGLIVNLDSIAENEVTGGIQHLAAKERIARDKVNLIEQRTIKRILEHPSGFENYVAMLYNNALTSCFDPHSLYLSKTEWENFQDELSVDGFSFGVDLEENETGNIVISRLAPGGPAWKSNELHKGDVLLKLKWAGKSSIDLTFSDIHEVESILSESNTDKLEITVKKASGGTRSVVLIKEKIRQDENIVKSYLLKGEKKIGYISLPGFYTEWENLSGMGCANDVAKEIIKLKRQNIEGLILDLRFNGGGALVEGLNLAGIFINEGPLFIRKQRGEDPEVIKDINRGTIYDGPLVVMVNGQSASASELVAATIQDYNRGLIVGSPTFGKATGQIVLPLNVRQQSVLDESGYLTVTVQKLYRINGKSAQLKGVQPDIHLPDVFESLGYREDNLPFALQSDSVDKKVYFSPLGVLPVKEIRKRSIDRIGKSNSFRAINQLIENWSYLEEDTVYLNIEAFDRKARENAKQFKAIEDIENDSVFCYEVENTTVEKAILNSDQYRHEINHLMIEKILKDFYIKESYRITSDLIELTNN